MFRYRNRDTAQVVEYPARSARLDHLGYRWELLDAPEPVVEVVPVVEVEPVVEPDAGDDWPGGEGTPDVAEAEVELLPEWPGSRGSKAELVDYVVARGLLDEPAARKLTRPELLDRYAPQD